MQLSLTQPRHWAVLLPLLSSMLLWEDVASVPLCKEINGQCQLTLEYLFNQERGLSENTKRLTLEIFNDLYKEYVSGPGIQDEIPPLCYKYSLPVPNITTEGQENQPKVLLKATIGSLVGWNNILKQVIDIPDLESITGVGIFLSKIRQISENFTKLAKLLKDVKSFINLVQPEFEEDEDYPVSAELPSLDLLHKPSPAVFYHALLGCLNYNAEKVATHIKILRCQMIPRKC